MGDNLKMPWRLLDLKFLIRDSQNSKLKLVHDLQVKYLINTIQQRLNNNVNPLVELYKSLHYFAQSLQLEVLFQQIFSLNRMTFGKFYKIVEYTNWKKLVVKYWLDYSKNQYGKFLDLI